MLQSLTVRIFPVAASADILRNDDGKILQDESGNRDVTNM
jgi:hypothetical protein